jgi:hypothetical protein
MRSWFVGIVAVCVAVSVLITVVDKRIFSRGKTGRSSVTPPDSIRADTTTTVSQVSEPQKQLSEASSYIDQASAYSQSWQGEIEPMLDGPEGEAVAVNEELVDKLAYLTREDRTPLAEIESTRQRIIELQEVANGAGANSLSSADMVEIRELHAKAKAADQEWQNTVTGARAIVGLAVSQASSDPNSKLDEQITQANHKATLDALDAQRVRKEEIAAKERELLERALSPEVAAVLTPFLEPRDVQPRLSGSSVRFRETLDKQPMSFAALQGMGALSNSIDGLERLAAVGGHRDLSEPRWSVHSQSGNWTDSDKEMLRQAQTFLREYGPILVQNSRLSP